MAEPTPLCKIPRLPGFGDGGNASRRGGLRPQTFDQYLVEEDFPRTVEGEELLLKAICDRNQDIVPTAAEQAQVSSLVIQVKTALETIITSNTLPSAKIEEFREVGSYKNGTMLAKRNVADLVIIFTTLPTHSTVKALGDKIVEILKETQAGEIFGVVPRDFGCEIAGTKGVLRLLITIPPDLYPKLDAELHLSATNLRRNMAALRHAVWFDENTGHPAVKMLVRIIKDIKSRAYGLKALDVWTIELLSHYSVTCTFDRNPLPLPHAFRRFFQLISAGFLLHNSIGVADPCDVTRRINYGFSPEEADCICRTSQFITRLLIHERYDRLFGLTNPQKDVAQENETDDTVNIAPLKEAFVQKEIINAPSGQFFSRN